MLKKFIIKIEKRNQWFIWIEIIKNKYNIEPISIKRTNNFKTNTKKSNIISAYEIREFLNKNESIKEYVPNNVTPYIKKVDYEKLFNLIKYKVISEKNSLNKYHLIDEGIENRIYEGVIKCDNYDDLVKYIMATRALHQLKIINYREK
mgnify:CR=1 FL=1